jgi:hypothetical protein
MFILLILIGAVMLVVETGSWLPPKKESAKPDEKKSALLPVAVAAKR